MESLRAIFASWSLEKAFHASVRPLSHPRFNIADQACAEAEDDIVSLNSSLYQLGSQSALTSAGWTLCLADGIGLANGLAEKVILASAWQPAASDPDDEPIVQLAARGASAVSCDA